MGAVGVNHDGWEAGGDDVGDGPCDAEEFGGVVRLLFTVRVEGLPVVVRVGAKGV